MRELDNAREHTEIFLDCKRGSKKNYGSIDGGATVWHNKHMPIHRAKERVLIARLYLRMTRRFNEAYFPKGEGSSPGRRRVAMVLFAATATGSKPMRLTQIAREAGHMSHQTALRRLDELEKMGIVEKHEGGYCIARDGAVNSLAAMASCGGNITDIINTAIQLKQLSTVDKRT